MGSYRFTKDYGIIYGNTAKDLKATPVALLQFLEDSAISHSDASNLGMDDLNAHQVSWVLSGWSIMVMRYPALSEKIRVETWASGFERFRATREFEIIDGQGDTIVKASSQWIFINTATKRPVRIPADFKDRYRVDVSASFRDILPDIDKIKKPDSSTDYRVRKRDIDSNGHVNNVTYLEWMLEAVDHETSGDLSPECIDIVYKNGITFGTMIESAFEVKTKDNKGQLVTLHEIKNKDKNTPSAMGKIFWNK